MEDIKWIKVRCVRFNTFNSTLIILKLFKVAANCLRQFDSFMDLLERLKAARTDEQYFLDSIKMLTKTPLSIDDYSKMAADFCKGFSQVEEIEDKAAFFTMVVLEKLQQYSKLYDIGTNCMIQKQTECSNYHIFEKNVFMQPNTMRSTLREALQSAFHEKYYEACICDEHHACNAFFCMQCEDYVSAKCTHSFINNSPPEILVINLQKLKNAMQVCDSKIL